MSQNPANQADAQRLAQQVEADRQASAQQQGLQAAPSVDLNFQHAQASPTPLEQREPSPAPPPERTTSFAKELDAQRQQEQQGQGTQGETEQGEGSGMVENDKPVLKPVNRTREGQAVDAAAYNDALANEAAEAEEANRMIEAIAAKQSAIDAAQAQQQPEMGRGQGMG